MNIAGDSEIKIWNSIVLIIFETQYNGFGYFYFQVQTIFCYTQLIGRDLAASFAFIVLKNLPIV